jgi:hypothetical protein
MIMREELLEAVEFTSSFNSRDDEYQVPSGSSHESAVGVGSYDWLDFAIETFTDLISANGSGRKSAHYNECFSIRSSTGIMNTEGRAYILLMLSKRGTPTYHSGCLICLFFFGRNLSRFSDFISLWYESSLMLLAPSKVESHPKLAFQTCSVLLVVSQDSLSLELSSDYECSAISSY